MLHCLILAWALSGPVSGLSLNDWKLASQVRESVQKTVSLETNGPDLSSDIESWLVPQADSAFESVIANIGHYGHAVGPEVLPGMVVASPSKTRPNYYYQWTRDAALSIDTLVSKYSEGGASNSTLEAIVDDYIRSSHLVQRVSNPSGDFESLDGLGEPKFMVDGRAFADHWGRPQRDGPALRASTIMRYLDVQQSHGKASVDHIKNVYEQVIKPDLEYTAGRWQLPGFDLWEEVNGTHFFTNMVQLRALVNGAAFAESLGDSAGAALYLSEAHALRQFVQYSFYDPSRGHIDEHSDTNPWRSGLDAATFLGVVYATDMDRWQAGDMDNDGTVFSVYSDELVASLHHMVQAMQTLYPINMERLARFQNSASASTVGVGIGRYPEDVYDGYGTAQGNPWFICTSITAHTLYMVADYLNTRDRTFVLNVAGQPLYSALAPQLDEPVLRRSDPRFNELVSSLVQYADSFLDVVREHAARDGSLSEQFSRYDGYMMGADRLTWSYSSLWAAAHQRNLTLSRLSMYTN